MLGERLGRSGPFNTRGWAQYYAHVHGRAYARGQGRRKILRRCGGREKAGVYTVYIPYTQLTSLTTLPACARVYIILSPPPPYSCLIMTTVLGGTALLPFVGSHFLSFCLSLPFGTSTSSPLSILSSSSARRFVCSIISCLKVGITSTVLPVLLAVILFVNLL